MEKQTICHYKFKRQLGITTNEQHVDRNTRTFKRIKFRNYLRDQSNVWQREMVSGWMSFSVQNCVVVFGRSLNSFTDGPYEVNKYLASKRSF